MSQPQLYARLGSLGAVNPPRSAKLSGYKLVFNKYAFSRSNEYDRAQGNQLGTARVGAANIVATGNPRDVVEGVVYLLNDAQIAELDRIEGARSNNSMGYKRKQIALHDSSLADTYIAAIPESNADNNLKPSASYVKLLLEASQYLSSSYKQKLLNTEVVDGGTVRDYIDVIADPRAVVQQNQSNRNNIVEGLERYIQRVESHKQNSTIDYGHGFWFFRDSRAKSREANCLLAKELKARLENNQPVNDILEIRRQLISQAPNLRTMTDRGINSSELFEIINRP